MPRPVLAPPKPARSARPARSIALLTAGAALAACLLPSGGDLDFRTVSRGIQTGLVGTAPLVARSLEEWQALWAQHASLQLPRPPAPEVDFAKEMVVCVLLGERPTGGFGLEVQAARAEGSDLLIAVRETRPEPDAVVPMLGTRPYQMIATRPTEGDVRIDWRASAPADP